MSVTVIWAVPLAVYLRRLASAPYNINIVPFNIEAYAKRIGVYYMCIDDLPL